MEQKFLVVGGGFAEADESFAEQGHPLLVKE
jgi:hypothetical protein